MTLVLDIFLFLHLLGLMFGAGGGFASAVAMGRAAALPPEQGNVIRSLGPTLAIMSLAGLVTMLVSGVSMVILKYGGAFAAMPQMFWVKMFFVATLTIAAVWITVIYGKATGGGTPNYALLARLGPMAGISSLLATLFAVMTFH